MSETERAALYARVSTGEDRQKPETQLRRLREYAERRGFSISGEYVDEGSGRSEEGRPAYQRLREGARQRAFGVAPVWWTYLHLNPSPTQRGHYAKDTTSIPTAVP